MITTGVAAVAIENTEGGTWIKQHYKHAHCIPEELQEQIDRQVEKPLITLTHEEE